MLGCVTARGGAGTALPHFCRTCCIAKCSKSQILQPLPAQRRRGGLGRERIQRRAPLSLDFHPPDSQQGAILGPDSEPAGGEPPHTGSLLPGGDPGSPPARGQGRQIRAPGGHSPPAVPKPSPPSGVGRGSLPAGSLREGFTGLERGNATRAPRPLPGAEPEPRTWRGSKPGGGSGRAG